MFRDGPLLAWKQRFDRSDRTKPPGTKAGGVDIHATTTFSQIGVSGSFSRSTDGNGYNSQNAHEDYTKPPPGPGVRPP